MRENETTEHEKEIDREVALLYEMGIVTWVELIEINCRVVIEHNPQSGDSPKRSQRRQLSFRIGRLGNTAFIRGTWSEMHVVLWWGKIDKATTIEISDPGPHRINACVFLCVPCSFCRKAMSAFGGKADIPSTYRNVRF